MRLTSFVCILTLLGSAACGKRAVTIDPGSGAEMASRWNGRLASPAGMAGVSEVQGNVWMAADGNRTHARIDVSNASPGGEHPWHVHRGRCGSNGQILGDAGDYPLLKIDGDGEASKEAHLDVMLPSAGDFYVNVHASRSNLETIIACTNLGAPTR